MMQPDTGKILNEIFKLEKQHRKEHCHNVSTSSYLNVHKPKKKTRKK